MMVAERILLIFFWGEEWTEQMLVIANYIVKQYIICLRTDERVRKPTHPRYPNVTDRWRKASNRLRSAALAYPHHAKAAYDKLLMTIA
jgi:hypothetical protein